MKPLTPPVVGDAPTPDKPSPGVSLASTPTAASLDDTMNHSMDALAQDALAQMIRDKIAGEDPYTFEEESDSDGAADEGDTDGAADKDGAPEEPLEPPSKRQRIMRPQAKPAPQHKSSGAGAGKAMKGKVMKKPSATVRKTSAVDRRPEYKEGTMAFKNPASNGALKPRYYGTATIYNDRTRHKWRVKPAPGRRDEQDFCYKKQDAKEAWAQLKIYLKVPNKRR